MGNDAEEHMEKTKEKQSKLVSKSGYAANCSTGFNKADYSQAHHILSKTCIETRSSYYKAGTEKYVEDCLWCTPWDIDASANLVGMPLNKQYKATAGATPGDLPSHQVDHNTMGGYTAEVSTWLQDNLWDTLTAKNKIHKVDVKTCEAQLNAGSNAFRAKLHAHATRNKGTKYSWDNRFDPVKGARWYFPFSMATAPNPRSPGVSLTNLLNIFKKLI